MTTVPPIEQTLLDWYNDALTKVLSAPHITIPPGDGIGPIDLFSTDYNNTFTSDAVGVVDGEEVGHAELKNKLLALNQHFNAATVTFHRESEEPQGASKSGQVRATLSWTAKDNQDVEEKVSTHALIVLEGEASRISKITLHGKADLFILKTSY